MTSAKQLPKGVRTRGQCIAGSPYDAKLKKTKQIHKERTSMKFFAQKFMEKFVCEDRKKQQIIINLDLGQYGFDSCVKTQIFQKFEDLLKTNQIFSINPNIDGIVWKDLCNQLTDKMKQQGYLVEGKVCVIVRSGNEQKYIEITKIQRVVWQCLYQLLSKIKEGSRFPGLFGIISQQIFNIRSILQKCSMSIMEIRKTQNWRQVMNIKQKYLEQLMIKTFKFGLQRREIDYLNYFLQKQYEENNRSRHIKLKITSQEEWADFISKKRVRLRKANKFLLHTACQLCLSPYFQESNRLINCPQCHLRGHQICLQTNSINRCGRCIYLRLSNQAKDKIPECFLCGANNLLPFRITSAKFAHIFCIVAHNIWKIQKQKVFIKQNIEEHGTKKQICHICNKLTNFYAKCERCDKISHYLCAFLNGSCLSIERGQMAKLQCCKLSSEEAKKLSQQRQFILNYENVVFKKLGQIKKMSKAKKCKDDCNEMHNSKMEAEQSNQEDQENYENDGQNQINQQ